MLKNHIYFSLFLLLGFLGCNKQSSVSKNFSFKNNPKADNVELRSLDPLLVILATQTGKEPIDLEISKLQEKIKKASEPEPLIEKLGWLFVSKARISFDPGYYKLAEQCALYLDSKNPESSEALLLRGHVLHSLHRFKEAESLARKLVAKREFAFDYGLLGDVLMEQGHLSEAVQAYQKMIDLKPDLHSYARGAHMRWLKGDLDGAINLMDKAAQAGSPNIPEATAWACSRLALYELQAGRFKEARQACDIAISFQPDYPPALLAKGRVLAAQGKLIEAVQAFERAATLNPLPEYQWILADWLRATGKLDEAYVLETQLKERGASNDPRTLSLYLTTRGEELDRALKLAEEEMATRSDVFTLDALAWSLVSVGKTEQAYFYIQQALAEGTEDGRLFCHAAVIATKAGKHVEALKWLKKSIALQQMLLPSEKKLLQEQKAALKGKKDWHA